MTTIAVDFANVSMIFCSARNFQEMYGLSSIPRAGTVVVMPIWNTSWEGLLWLRYGGSPGFFCHIYSVFFVTKCSEASEGGESACVNWSKSESLG